MATKMRKPLDCARGRKAWKSFEITKVRLNPEQAVLSCCDATGKSDGTLNQCQAGPSCFGLSGAAASS